MDGQITIPQEKIAEFCRQNKIRKLSLFGSVLRADFGPESDVDVLVEFEAGCSVGLIAFARMQLDLSDLLGRRVDLRTPGSLSRYFRQKVMATAKVQYERAG